MNYTPELVLRITSDASAWQCIDCKACIICNDSGDPVSHHCYTVRLCKVEHYIWCSCVILMKNVGCYWTPVFSRSIGRHQFFWPLIFETPATITRQSSNTFVCIWDKFYLPGYWKSSEEHGNFHIWYAEYTNGAKLWRKTPFGHSFLELLCTCICIDCGFWIKKFCCLVIKFTPNMPLHSEEYSCE